MVFLFKQGKEVKTGMESYRPPYEISDRCANLLSAVSEKLGRLNITNLSGKPLLRKISRISSVYSSLKIEANSLPQDKVTAILDGKPVIGPVDEIREVENAFRAYEKIDDFNPFSLSDVKRMHALLTDGLCPDAGEFRRGREGVFSGNICIYMAPEPEQVPVLMDALLHWMNAAKGIVHPAIIACIAHYELVFIHPFSDGNGRLARLWQMAILATWNPQFRFIPVENSIRQHQQAYYNVIDRCNHADTITEFLEFMLAMMDEAVEDAVRRTEQITAATDCEHRLLNVMEYGHEYSSAELQKLLGLKSRDTLRDHYLHPAIADGIIRMKYPDAPANRNQRYIRN